MTRKISVFSALLVLCAFFLLPSCAKKEAPDTPFSRVQGRWKKIKYATDDNANGVIDPEEIHPVATSLNDQLLIKGDTTGIETTIVNKNSESPLPFRWYIGAGDSLTLIYTAHYTITYGISEISSGDLTLVTNTSLGIAWYYYIKL